MSFPHTIKDPASVLDYEVDWTNWLSPINDTITSVQWIVPADLTVTQQSHTSTVATVWLSGGTLDVVDMVTCRLTSTGGRTEDYSFLVQIMNK